MTFSDNVRFWHKAAMHEGKVRYERGAESTIFLTVGYPWDLVFALDEKRKSKKLAAFLVLIPSVLF